MTVTRPLPCFYRTAPFLSGWTYRKSVTLSRASGAVSNYQMKLLLGESSGATGESVDCAGHVATDFDDLRFTTSDGVTTLDYWIESLSGATPNQLATVWIEFDSIGTAATTFYMYYGNAGAVAFSNGVNTFLSFNDFTADTVGVIPSGWSETENAGNGTTLTTAGGYSGNGAECISTSVTYGGGRTGISPGTQWCTEARVKFAAGNGEFVTQNSGSYRGAVRKVSTSTKIQTLDLVPAYWHDSAVTAGTGWHKIKIYVYDTNLVVYDIDGSTAAANAIINSSQAMNTVGTRFQETGTIDVDEVFVRNYRITEPAWGSWGAENTG